MDLVEAYGSFGLVGDFLVYGEAIGIAVDHGDYEQNQFFELSQVVSLHVGGDIISIFAEQIPCQRRHFIFLFVWAITLYELGWGSSGMGQSCAVLGGVGFARIYGNAY